MTALAARVTQLLTLCEPLIAEGYWLTISVSFNRVELVSIENGLRKLTANDIDEQDIPECDDGDFLFHVALKMVQLVEYGFTEEY